VNLRAGIEHDIALVDEKGRPVVAGPDINAYVRYKSGKGQTLEVETGRIFFPVFFKGSGTLRIRGIDFPQMEIEIDTDALPRSLTVKARPLLMSGRIEFPDDFSDWDEVAIEYSVAYADAVGCSKQKGLFFDRTTGAFRVKRLSEGPGSTGAPGEAVYKIIITIPGFQPWTKKGIRLKPDETMSGVVVRFQK
ncbi:MAG: hypothetical protein ACYS47_14475, partial [Planctomycetota bacterium]|jgi:hypothetical protein